MLKKSFMFGRVEMLAVSACNKICVQVQKMWSKNAGVHCRNQWRHQNQNWGGGEQRGQEKILGGGSEKMHVKQAKICYLCQFYASKNLLFMSVLCKQKFAIYVSFMLRLSNLV